MPPQQVPLLNWPVPSLSTSPAHWRQVAGQFRLATDRPLMVRPLFPVGSAAAHRRAWRALVKGFRAEKVRNVAWLWTPPRPDVLAAYFPGAPYVDWLVADHPTGSGANGYSAVRRQVASQFDLHPKPVLLLATLSSPNPGLPVLVRRVVANYPEIKAVVYDRVAPNNFLILKRPASRQPLGLMAQQRLHY